MRDINILGIDLGTTNSEIAIWDLELGKPRVLPNREQYCSFKPKI